MALFDTLHASGNTIVLVTHEPDIAEFAHRIVHIRDGQIFSDEPSKRFLTAGPSRNIAIVCGRLHAMKLRGGRLDRPARGAAARLSADGRKSPARQCRLRSCLAVENIFPYPAQTNAYYCEKYRQIAGNRGFFRSSSLELGLLL
jgi:energy-coupling factor transporter ATP-binding protein EcfA2